MCRFVNRRARRRYFARLHYDDFGAAFLSVLSVRCTAVLALLGYCTATAQPWTHYTIVNSMMLGYPRASDLPNSNIQR